jgi:sugar phosphate isomerase/epimerase
VKQRHLSLGYLTVMDVSPAETVSVAAATGYDGISLAIGSSFLPARMRMDRTLQSVIEDADLRRDTVRRARDTGVSLDQMEGFILHPEVDLARWRMALDLTAEMGIPQIAAFDADFDRTRASDNLAALCEMAAERGLGVCLEFHPKSPTNSVAETARLIETGKYRGLKILVDALHLARGGGTPADVAKVPQALLDCAQMSDGPLVSESAKAYALEAMFNRQAPGEGELPLVDLIRAMPADGVLYLEVPQCHARDRGVSAAARAQRAIDGLCRVLEAAL